MRLLFGASVSTVTGCQVEIHRIQGQDARKAFRDAERFQNGHGGFCRARHDAAFRGTRPRSSLMADTRALTFSIGTSLITSCDGAMM